MQFRSNDAILNSHAKLMLRKVHEALEDADRLQQTTMPMYADFHVENIQWGMNIIMDHALAIISSVLHT